MTRESCEPTVPSLYKTVKGLVICDRIGIKEDFLSKIIFECSASILFRFLWFCLIIIYFGDLNANQRINIPFPKLKMKSHAMIPLFLWGGEGGWEEINKFNVGNYFILKHKCMQNIFIQQSSMDTSTSYPIATYC